MRSSLGSWLLLVGSLAVIACGRVPLDDPATGSGGASGPAGAAGSGASGAGASGGAIGTAGRVPSMHRPTAAACPMLAPPTSMVCPLAGLSQEGNCSADADCVAGIDGRCVGFLPQGNCSCTYDACFSDGDCARGEVCACSGSYSGNACVTSACHVDADCGFFGFCSPEADHCTGAVLGYFCRTSRDTCVNDSDCGTGSRCERDPDVGIWTCRLAGDGCPL
jgi:hypothetical protein